MKIQLTILGEPASKANSRQLVTFGKRPALIKSQKAREYEASARSQIPREAMVMLDTPVRFTANIFYATRRPDLDESIILDVLQAQYRRLQGGKRILVRQGVYTNDRLVHEKHVYWGLDASRPRAEITIETLVDDVLFTPANEPQTIATNMGGA